MRLCKQGRSFRWNAPPLRVKQDVSDGQKIGATVMTNGRDFQGAECLSRLSHVNGHFSIEDGNGALCPHKEAGRLKGVYDASFERSGFRLIDVYVLYVDLLVHVVMIT